GEPRGMHSAPVRVHSPGTAAVRQIPATTCEDDCFPRIHSSYDYDVLLTQENPNTVGPGRPLREPHRNARGTPGKRWANPEPTPATYPVPGNHKTSPPIPAGGNP